jgi:hypothetical protein
VPVVPQAKAQKRFSNEIGGDAGKRGVSDVARNSGATAGEPFRGTHRTRQRSKGRSVIGPCYSPISGTHNVAAAAQDERAAVLQGLGLPGRAARPGCA